MCFYKDIQKQILFLQLPQIFQQAPITMNACVKYREAYVEDCYLWICDKRAFRLGFCTDCKRQFLLAVTVTSINQNSTNQRELQAF